MSLVGKIQSLFLDREKTQPIFPITKVKAVSDDNGKGLNVLLDDKASKDFVTAKIAEAQLGGSGGEIDLSGFATKDDLNAVNDKIPTTPEQIGAHPNTWMPTASDVGAAPAGHVTDKNNPHGVTIAQIGAAPAGYGLGDVCTVLDLNNVTKTGWYKGSPGYVSGVPNSYYTDFWYCSHIEAGVYNGAIQRAYYNPIVYPNCAIVRTRNSDGTWSEWEWENPPMSVGVEYRTTERWNGKAVYTKCVSFGYMPGNGEASVEHGLATTAVWVDKVLADYSSGQVEVTIGAFGVTSIQITRTVMFLLANGNFSTIPVYFYLKYTKD